MLVPLQDYAGGQHNNVSLLDTVKEFVQGENKTTYAISLLSVTLFGKFGKFDVIII